MVTLGNILADTRQAAQLLRDELAVTALTRQEMAAILMQVSAIYKAVALDVYPEGQ